MKKSLLVLVALAALGLAACDGDAEPSKVESEQPSGQVAEVPTEEGKCTFFFTMGEGSPVLKEYESPYMTGGAFGWKTGYEAVAFEKLAGSENVYYAQIANDAFDATVEQGTDYQLLLGYNSKANMADASSGLQWVDSRKSDVSASIGGLGNPTFTYEAGAQKVDLGTHVFSASLPTPSEPLKNVTLRASFAEAVPETHMALIFGSFNGWKTPSGSEDSVEEDTARVQAAKMTPSEDRKVWTIVLPEVIANAGIEYLICIEEVSVVNAITWNKIDQTKDANGTFDILQADGDNAVIDIVEDATFSIKSAEEGEGEGEQEPAADDSTEPAAE